MTEEPKQPEQVEEQPKVDQQTQAAPKSKTGLIIVIVIVVLVILLGLGGLGLWIAKKKISSSISGILNVSATAVSSLTPSRTQSATSATSSTTSSVASSGTTTTTQNQTINKSLNEVATKYFDWIIARQNAGDNYLESKSYQNLDVLSADFINGVAQQVQEYQINPFIYGPDMNGKIDKYKIESAYSDDGMNGEVYATGYSGDQSWAIILQLKKVNGAWQITYTGTAG
ncbi:MAG: hypothetical protein NTZ65_01105 [Candidatus Berkelbacteria bacterium]|nr:hypothetical protein [Candidatus Berkelbacteria bacterium]